MRGPAIVTIVVNSSNNRSKSSPVLVLATVAVQFAAVSQYHHSESVGRSVGWELINFTVIGDGSYLRPHLALIVEPCHLVATYCPAS